MCCCLCRRGVVDPGAQVSLLVTEVPVGNPGPKCVVAFAAREQVPRGLLVPGLPVRNPGDKCAVAFAAGVRVQSLVLGRHAKLHVGKVSKPTQDIETACEISGTLWWILQWSKTTSSIFASVNSCGAAGYCVVWR